MSGLATGAERVGSDTSRRVMRHPLVDRLYHWAMALAVFTLMGTAFLPILGVKFAWVDIHWISGVVLAALVLIHIVRALLPSPYQASMMHGFGPPAVLFRVTLDQSATLLCPGDPM